MVEMDLIHSFAWRFHKNTGVNFDDLLGEAMLAYCEALEAYDASRGVKATTYACSWMRNHLIIFCEREHRIQSRLTWIGDWPEALEPRLELQEEDPLEERMKEWPDRCRTVARMVLENPERYLNRTPSIKRTRTRRLLRTRLLNSLCPKGWTDEDLDQAIENLKQFV